MKLRGSHRCRICEKVTPAGSSLCSDCATKVRSEASMWERMKKIVEESDDKGLE